MFERMPDEEALDRIAELLRVEEWQPRTLDFIAEVVLGTGRVTWEDEE